MKLAKTIWIAGCFLATCVLGGAAHASQTFTFEGKGAFDGIDITLFGPTTAQGPNDDLVQSVFDTLYPVDPSDSNQKVDDLPGSGDKTVGALTITVNANSGGLNGSWSWNASDEGVIAIILKGSNDFLGIAYSEAVTGDNWCMDANCAIGGVDLQTLTFPSADFFVAKAGKQRKNSPGLSNITAFAVETPAVPEPSTWLMMMAGFGLTGLSLKGRKRKAIA